MNKDEYYQEKLERFEDKADRIFERILPDNPKSFHIVGICGKAMGPLAGLLSAKGYKVKGSDQACYPPISTMLENMKADIHVGNYEAGNVGDVDVVVIGNVVRPHNPEAKYARENNIPQVSVAEALMQYVVPEKKSLVCAGTHGKTTTTGLLSHIFEMSGKDPSYLIGGVPQGAEFGFKYEKGEHFIIEGDEYDTAYFDKHPKFLLYKPYCGIVTSLELDHLDIYDDFEDYKKAFQFFAESIPEEGTLLLNCTSPDVKELKDYAKCNAVFYGDNDCDIFYHNLEQTEEGQTFDLVDGGKVLGTVSTPLSGTYNVLNILACWGIARENGIGFNSFISSVKSFKGMKRRQEVIYKNGVTVIDDFAHHPTAVRETLDGIRNRYKDNRIIVLFEPGTNTSRKKIFEEDYINSFDGANFVCIKSPKLREGDNPEDFINIDYISKKLEEKGIKTSSCDKVDGMIEDIVEVIKDGDIILIMSNTAFDNIQEKLVDRLKKTGK